MSLQQLDDQPFDLYTVLDPLVTLLTSDLPAAEQPRLIPKRGIDGLCDVAPQRAAVYEVSYPVREDLLTRLSILIAAAGGNTFGFTPRNPAELDEYDPAPIETPIRFGIIRHSTWSVCETVDRYYLHAVVVDEGGWGAAERQVAHLIEYLARAFNPKVMAVIGQEFGRPRLREKINTGSRSQ
jgi:hypothetical protein